MTGPLFEVDDEFADFVRARQHQLLRAAYLLRGDEQEAERLVRGAFTTLSLRWRAVRDEDLDAFVRRVLYRDATSRRTGRHVPPVRETLAGQGPGGLLAALAELSPRQRAVTVLRHFEQRTEHDTAEALGISAHAVAAQERAARQRLHELLPPYRGDPTRGLTAADLGRALDDASAQVEERDVVEAAREAARAHRRRRRRIGAGGLAAVTALVVGAVVVPRGRDLADLPTVERTSPDPSLAAEWDPSEVDVLGLAAQVGPTARQLASLPRISDLTRSQLALPEVLAFGPDTRIPSLSEVGGSGAPVRAVLLRHAPEGLRAVLFRPTLANPYVLVDTVPLVPTLDEDGDLAEPLEVRAIADDRRRVMFVQPGKVHVLDAFTGEVRTFPVADRYLEEGGWVGEDLVVWSETLRFRITPATGQVRRVSELASPARHEVEVEGADGLRVLGFDERGTVSTTRTGPNLLSAVWGSTFTNDDDQLATGGFLSEPAALDLNRQRPQRLFQGVLTLDAQSLARGRLLVAPESEGVRTGCCEVLGWAYLDEVLVRWRDTDLLTWNARTGALRRVSTLPGRQQDPPIVDSAAWSVALAP